jgi:hypothetical protein
MAFLLYLEKKNMKAILPLLLSLLAACQNSPQTPNLYQGSAQQLQWLVSGQDTLLYTYSISTQTRRGYSNTGSSATVSSQTGQHLVFRLRDTSLKLIGQQNLGCAKPQTCGSRNFDRLLAYGQDKILLYCECEKQWSLWSCTQHQELFNSTNAPFLSPGQQILETKALLSPPDVLKLSLSDGQVLYYSLNNGLLSQPPNTSGNCGDGPSIPSLIHQNKRLSFQTIGQGQQYQLALCPNETWLEPSFLRAANSCQAWQSPQGCWILHRKSLDPKNNLPNQMSFVNWQGEIKSRIDISKFHQNNQIQPAFWAQPPYLYLAHAQGLAIYNQDQNTWLREK